MVQVALLGRDSCDVVSPGFRAATHSGYERWRSENAAAIASIEASAEFQSNLARYRQHVKNLSAKERREMEDLCAALRDAFEGRPPDPRLATPTMAWELFLASLRSADRATALKCLTSAARAKFREALERMPDDAMRGMGSSFVKFAITDTLKGKPWEGFAVDNTGRGFLIYFEEINGEWRIAEM